jgi:regulator of replication initiation timing
MTKKVKTMEKKTVYDQERMRLTEVFGEIDEKQKRLIETLIDEAAFLVAENSVLKKHLEQTGMVVFHPSNPNLQKQVPTATQYLKNLNAYTVVIKTLATILNKQPPEEEDNDLEDFE